MKVLHASAECYPAAKAGGLGDVVGALPKYLTASGNTAAVILPKYQQKWILEQKFTIVFQSSFRLHNQTIFFSVEKIEDSILGYPFYVVAIPGKFDRPGIYADPHSGYPYGDETERYICFQQSILTWVKSLAEKPKIIHCHDHHTGLIPFMMKHCPEYKILKDIPTVFTIHNGQYHGAFRWDKMHLLPFFDAEAYGLLDWNNTINSLATGVKCAWKVTTVSPSYMEELSYNSLGLESLFKLERQKCIGIINGIDNDVWNPETDQFIYKTFDNDIEEFKAENKKAICHRFKIDYELPLITFIGRLVGEKGADLLVELITRFIGNGNKAAFVVLGTGDPKLKEQFLRLKEFFFNYYDTSLEYNEGLSHQLYAGSDFLIMPSRVEPCGLNQLYSFRYGTIPIVRAVGGLKDTVIDIGDDNGRGIRFNNFSISDIYMAASRAVSLYENKESIAEIRKRIMKLDFSWEQSCKNYLNIYKNLDSKF